MNLRNVDLNLLVVLDALLAERNVSRAGRRVGLSQSAMSAALARLRILFRDPLLVRSGRNLALTQGAEELEPISKSSEEDNEAGCHCIQAKKRSTSQRRM